MQGLIETGTVELYHELRGSGAPLLLITGGTGDAGEWSGVAPVLAERLTVITYDRRGMSRSPLAGSPPTSMPEQAADAAGLLRTLVREPAIVVGHSGGASIACCLVARDPELVRHAVLYEPPLLAIVPDGEAVVAGFGATIDQAMAEGGPRRALEQFMRANAGDDVVDDLLASMPAAELDRILGNGQRLFERELAMFAAFVPDRDAMRASGVPLTVVVGAENRDTWYGDAARWLADGTGASLVELPGGHAGIVTHPDAFIELVRRVADGGA